MWLLHLALLKHFKKLIGVLYDSEEIENYEDFHNNFTNINKYWDGC